MAAPRPLGDNPVAVQMLGGSPRKFVLRWGLSATLQYEVKQRIPNDYEFGANVRCSPGSESSEYWVGVGGSTLSDLRAGDVARGSLGVPPNVRLAAKPERCELDFGLRNSENETDVHPLQTFCWTPDEITPGKCGDA